MSKNNIHFHDIDDFANLNEILEEKSENSHTHNVFTKKQLLTIMRMLNDKTLFKSITFDIQKNVIYCGDSAILNNFKVIDLEDNYVSIDYDYMYIIFDDGVNIPIHDLKKSKSSEFGEYFELPNQYLEKGVHNFCIKYKDSYSEDFQIFVMDKNNLLDVNVWSGTDYMSNTKGIVTGAGQFVESSVEWNDTGERSLKIISNNSYSNWTDVYTAKVFGDDTVTASGKILNTDSDVSIFFVFIDSEGNQSFSNSALIGPSNNPQDFTLKSSINNDINKIHLRFWLKGELGSSIYIDDINIVSDSNKKHVGVLGSCAVNGPFTTALNKNYKKNYIREVKDQGHSLISIMQPKISVDNSLLFIPNEFDVDGLNRDCLIRDFEKRFIDVFLLNYVDYLLMDVYVDVDKGVLRYGNNTLISNIDGFEKTKFAKTIKNIDYINVFNNPEEFFKLWKSSCDKFFNFLKFYSPRTKVILCEMRVIDKKQGFDGKIYHDELLNEKADKYNPWIEKLENYIKENHDVLVLSFDEEAYYKENDFYNSLIFNENYYSTFLEKLDILIDND